MHDAHGGDARGDQFDRVLPKPLDLDPEPTPVGDQKAEIADLRNIDARVVHLIDDAAADREPEPRHPERATDHFFVAARPGRRYSGAARSRPAGRHRG